MPKIDKTKLTPRTGSGYPGALAALMDGRAQMALGDPAGLTQFGVNQVRLEPGAMSSLRHWHERQDEFVMVIMGTCTLIDDTGDTPMQPGDCAAFPAGDANGHHLVNKTDAPAEFLVVGTRTETETAYYSDIDMMASTNAEGTAFTRKDGSPLTADQTGDKK